MRLNLDLQPLFELWSQLSLDALILPLKIMGTVVGLLWGLECLDALLFRGRLDRLGIYPRTLEGLWGILFSPLLHGSFKHLAANTMPLAILGGLILLGDLKAFVVVTGLVWLVSGVGVWLVGRPRSLHIGASGIVFGYLGFLLAQAYFEGSFALSSRSVLGRPFIWVVGRWPCGSFFTRA